MSGTGLREVIAGSETVYSPPADVFTSFSFTLSCSMRCVLRSRNLNSDAGDGTVVGTARSSPTTWYCVSLRPLRCALTSSLIIRLCSPEMPPSAAPSPPAAAGAAAALLLLLGGGAPS